MKPFRVVGTSMWPVLKEGDLVFVETKVPKPGDLVLRVIDEMPTIHRFIDFGITKGDRYSEADPGRTPDESEWKTVTAVVPRKFAHSPGQFKSATLPKADLNARLQSWFSRRHLAAPGKLKLVLLPALILNGFLIRVRISAQCQRTLNVVHDEL